MNLDVDKLGCGPSDLLDFLYILKQPRPSHIYVLAMRGELQLSAITSGDRNATDQVTITVPYKGKRCEGFVPLKEFSNSLRTDQGVLTFQTDDKPADWQTKLATRGRDLIDLNAKNLHQTMEYLLRITHKKRDDWTAGLIFSKKEIVATDGRRMHVDTSLPNMINFDQTDDVGNGADYKQVKVPGRALMGLGAASALMRATRLMPAAKILGGHQHSDDTNKGFVFELKYGKTLMVITSRPWVQARSTQRGRPPGDENNATFTVYKDHLETVLKSTVRSFKDFKAKLSAQERASLLLTHATAEGAPVLRATSNPSQAAETHDLICSPTQGFVEGRWIELDAEYLMDAIQGMGPNIQFVLPTHPLDALQHCYVNPVYITGKPGRFAVVSPICDRDTATKVFDDRRRNDIRKTHSDCEYRV